MNSSKKYLWIVLVGIILILLIIASSVGNKDSKRESSNKLSENVEEILSNAQKESSNVKEEEKKDLPEINMDTYLEYYNGEDKKIVLIARPTCSYCQVAEPIIKKVAKDYDLPIDYLNTDNFQDEDTQKLINSDEFFKEGYGTPILLVIGQGKIIDKVDGLTDSAHYIDFFKKNEFIK